MTLDEQIRLATFVSGAVAIVVTILLFGIREWLDSRRRRRKAATSLALYSTIVVRTLERNARHDVPFSMKDIVDASAEIIDSPAVLNLLGETEECLALLDRAKLLSQAIDRQQRAAQLEATKITLTKHLGTFGIAPNQSVGLGLSKLLGAKTALEQQHIADLFGKLEWDTSFDYKAERSRQK
jgi:hypothetical protein